MVPCRRGRHRGRVCASGPASPRINRAFNGSPTLLYGKRHRRDQERHRGHRVPNQHEKCLPPSTVIERFMDKVSQEPNSGCWLWTAALNRHGYGAFSVLGKTKLAHRVGYELLVGAIPDELALDHLCSVVSCVNPAHLEPVTDAENTRRILVRAGIWKDCRRLGHAVVYLPRCRTCANTKLARRRKEKTRSLAS